MWQRSLRDDRERGLRFDLLRLGDVRGLDGIHLQCHLGTDTLSLARLGARMTGLDFSSASLAQARALGAQRFDLVFTDVPLGKHRSLQWNHGLGEVVTPLLEQGLTLTALTEHDSVPWQPFPGRMERVGLDEWRLADRPWRLPHSYTLQATKP